MEIPDWDEWVHQSIKDVLRLVGGRLALLTTADDGAMARQLAACYLARVRRLVMGMDVLYEAGMPDLIGSLMRVCLEAWVTGMWVVLMGDATVEMLAADHAWRTNRFIQNAQLGVPLLDEMEDSPNLPRIETRAREVNERLVAEGRAVEGEVMWSYRLIYGGESGAGIHGGWASIAGHLNEQTEWTGVLAERKEAGDGAAKLLWVASLLALLARRVFIEFGVGVDDLDRAAEPIQVLGHDLNQESQP